MLDPAAAPDPARAEAQLLEQMRAGKIEISGGADDDGRAIVTVRVRANDLTRSAPADYARLLVYSVLWALRDNPEAQRQGVVFFVDATDVSLRNSDPPTSKLTKWVAGQPPVRSRADRGLQRAVCLWICDGAARARGDARAPSPRQARQ